MGMKYKYSHWCSTPIDRSGLRDIVHELEQIASQVDSGQPIKITVTSSKNITIELPPEQFSEFVAIMKFTLNED